MTLLEHGTTSAHRYFYTPEFHMLAFISDITQKGTVPLEISELCLDTTETNDKKE